MPASSAPTIRFAPRARRCLLIAVAALGCLASVACKRSSHARVSSYMPLPLPAGFVEQSGAGWRIGVPSTWRDMPPKSSAVFAAADPQAVDDFHAYANVVTEPFAGESDDYARANQAALGREPRATIETARQDAIDGDATLIVESRWSPLPP